jgi:hypothetical protein
VNSRYAIPTISLGTSITRLPAKALARFSSRGHKKSRFLRSVTPKKEPPF